ncbi:MAG: NfeD family protein [Verrucomicrobiales bacterium]
MSLIATLLVVGFVLLLLETVLPGLIVGIIGTICIASGVIMSYEQFGMKTGNTVLLVVVILLSIGLFLWVRFFPGSPMAKIFISNSVIGDVGAERPELLDQTGVAQTSLRPSGAAIIAGKRIDVVTEGDYIEKGETVKVVGIEGLRVVVRKA